MIVLLNIVSIILIILGIFLLILSFVRGKNNDNPPIPSKIQNPHYAILIPARNESKVIEGLLKSLKEQTYSIDMQDVYVIVEDKSDPTVQITKQYGGTIFVRKNPELRRKGYALDEAVRMILKEEKEYDAYFIFDADNILSPTFLEEMTDTYRMGYDTAVGSRESKNGTRHHLISVCSILTFTMLNVLGNQSKVHDQKNIIIPGSGFYIKGDWIKKWRGYPFHTLTEDYEFSMYACLNGLTTGYNKKAIVYDEQPTTYSQSRTQRTRWIRGFIECRKKYAKKLKQASRLESRNQGSKYAESLGITPYVLMVVGAVLEIVTNLVTSFILLLQNKEQYFHYFILGIGIFLLVYVVLMLFTILLLHSASNLNLTPSMKIKTIFFNPFFLITYVPCALEALFRKEIGWQPIEHKVEVIEKG